MENDAFLVEFARIVFRGFVVVDLARGLGEAVAGRLRVVAYEDPYVERPKPAMVQRIAAVNISEP